MIFCVEKMLDEFYLFYFFLSSFGYMWICPPATFFTTCHLFLEKCFLTCFKGDTKNVLTGSADNSCRLWDCETGWQCIIIENTHIVLFFCAFFMHGNNKATKGYNFYIYVYIYVCVFKNHAKPLVFYFFSLQIVF